VRTHLLERDWEGIRHLGWYSNGDGGGSDSSDLGCEGDTRGWDWSGHGKRKGVRGTLTGMFEDEPGPMERKQPAKAGGNGHDMKTSK